MSLWSPLPVKANGDSGKRLECCSVRGDNLPRRRCGSRGNDQVVGTTGRTGSTGVDEQFRMSCGHVDVVVDHRDRRDDRINERSSRRSASAVGEQHAHLQLRNGEGEWVDANAVGQGYLRQPKQLEAFAAELLATKLIRLSSSRTSKELI